MNQPQPLKRAVVVGAGALGSNALIAGRNLPAQWAVIDFDRVEQKNTLSQAHTRMGLGRNKAQALQQILQGLWGLRVEAIPHKLTEDNAATLLAAADVVVDCTDNAAARALILRACAARAIPSLHGALAADGSYGRVLWGDAFTPDPSGDGQATCEDGAHLPFITITSAYLCAALQRFLLDGARLGFHIHPTGATLVTDTRA
jgi:threonine dehydrogenase-like Zn-dependent dehydrogenase